MKNSIDEGDSMTKWRITAKSDNKKYCTNCRKWIEYSKGQDWCFYCTECGKEV